MDGALGIRLSTHGALAVTVLVHQLLYAVIARVQSFALARRKRIGEPVAHVARPTHVQWPVPAHI